MARPAKFEAGKYWIGDMCYPGIDFPTDKQGVFWRGSHKCWWHYTYGGDGVFWGTNDAEYGVDGGNLGILPAELVPNGEGGHFHEFTRPFEVQYTCDGMFVFGDVLILTNYELISELEGEESKGEYN